MCGLVAVVAVLATAGLAAAAAVTERVSVATGGGQANGGSFSSAVSADGRYVALQSAASNLAAGDSNGWTDIFVRDRQTGTTERVSVATGGGEANHISFTPTISADGRYVGFESFASNLVPGDTNGTFDIFVHDRLTGVTERVSGASAGGEADAESHTPTISADGRHVAFESLANNLVPGDTNGSSDIFVHDRQTGATERVSVVTGGAEADGASLEAAINADGHYVTFSSSASNLVAGDSNGATDVFIHDRQSGATERVSVSTGGTQADGGSFDPAISADGNQVAFTSQATNLVAGDSNGFQDILVHDRQTGATERVSIATGGTQANLDSFGAAISGDGRHVAFSTQATNLAGSDSNGIAQDVLIHDRQTDATERAGVATNGAQASTGSDGAAISSDGSRVAFWSEASNLVAGDTNGSADVFMRVRGVTACNDGLDNDNDGAIDYPNDPGCNSSADNNETNARCNDGLDNDNDGHTDYPSDPGCTSPADNNEANARCNDGLDNDNDGLIDFPQDPGCTSATDNNETNPQCNDGLDNDGDGNVDYPQDPGCSSLIDNRENTAPTVTLVTDPGPGEPFQFGDTLAFDVIVTDDAPVDCSRLLVTYILRHAQHGHPQAQTRACSGAFDTDDESHVGADDTAALIIAEYTDAGGLKATDEVEVPPNP